MAALVTVSIGSNIDAERNIRRAIDEMKCQFDRLTISPVYQTEAIGFDGDDFLNLVVSFKTKLSVQSVSHALKSIEDLIGRDRSQVRFSARSIDLDLLTYDDLIVDQPGLQIPRHEILQNAFVLKPLSDIHPQLEHPVNHRSFEQLWQDMQQHAARIAVYPLDLS